MKMVAASKFGRAEKDLKFAKPYGTAAGSKLLNCTTMHALLAMWACLTLICRIAGNH